MYCAKICSHFFLNEETEKRSANYRRVTGIEKTYGEEFVDILAFYFQLVAVNVAQEHHHEVIRHIIIGGLSLFLLCKVMRKLCFKVD